MALKTKWELVDFNELIEQVSYTKKIDKKDYLKSGKYPIIDQSETFISGFWDNDEDVFKIKKPVVLFGDHTRIFKYVDFDFVLGADGIKILQPIESVDPKFFYYIVSNIDLPNLGYSRHFKELKRKKIPLPPLPVQQELVTRLDKQQAIIEQCNAMEKTILEAGIDDSIFEGDWEWVELGELVDYKGGLSITINDKIDANGIPIITINDIGENGELKLDSIRKIKIDKEPRNLIHKGELLFNWRNGSPHLVGKTALYDLEQPALFASFLLGISIRDSSLLNSRFLWFILNEFRRRGIYLNEMRRNVNGVFNRDELSLIKIPLPPLEKQQEIVDFLNAQFETLNTIRRLKENAKKTIKMILDREVFGE